MIEERVLRKWFELSSVVPLAVYVLIHAVSYAGALFGARNFGEGTAAGIELVLEICLVWAPLAFHVAYGTLLIARGAEPSDANSRRTWVLRVSGVAALAFLVFHAWWLRGPMLSGEQTPDDTALRLAGELSSLHFGVPILAILHLLGLAVVSVHLASGLARFFANWRVTSAARAESVARALSIALFAVGSATVVELATGSALPHFQP